MIAILARRSLAVTIAGLGLAAVADAQVAWTQSATSNAPAPQAGYAWDSGRDRMVAYGGEVLGVAQNATREWNGSIWATQSPAVFPPGRSRPAMCYDEARGVTVMFGGFNGGLFLQDTWEYNGTTWTQRQGAGGPSPRSGAAMAYDSERQVCVLFGGFVQAGTDVGDVWEWDGTSWSPRPSIGGAPAARGAHRMVYDSARQLTLVCGGYRTPLQATVSDCWAWDGTAWTQQASLPLAICDQALAYDPTRRRTVLFGGLTISGATFTDRGNTYELGTAWTQRTTVGTPAARSGLVGAWDQNNQRVVVAGGTASSGSFSDTWTYRPQNLGTVTEYGSFGCAVTAGAELEITDRPYLGLPFRQRLVGASPAAPIGIMVFGTSDTVWSGIPLPLDLNAAGAPGCFLHASLDVPFTFPLLGGEGSFVWSIPNQANAVGFQVYTQAFVLDPTSPLPFQIDATTARACVVGNP